MEIYFKKFIKLIILLSFVTLTACSQQPPKQDGIMVLSMSTNGQYIIASTLRNKLLLFNIKNHTKKLISNTANIYSAYFSKNANAFIWQNNKNNQVTVESINGQTLQIFNPGFPTYGEVITSNLQTYIASDVNFNLYIRKNKKSNWIKQDSTGFYGLGKLLNLKISNNNKQLLTCGGDDGIYDMQGAIPSEKFKKLNYPLDGVILWSLKKLKPIFGFTGHAAKSFANFSSLSKRIVSGDENLHLFLWDVLTGKKIYQGYNINLGKLVSFNSATQKFKWDPSVLKVLPPSSYHSPDNINSNSPTISLNFIDKTHYLQIVDDIPYAILYNITDPSPLKYLKLNTNPYPSINSYVRDESIDSSWQTHTLVVGHATDPGITVYKYDPKQQTLNVVWNTQ